MKGRRPRVFISYSHDSPEHQARVEEFAVALQSLAEVWFDGFVADSVDDWPLWCEKSFREADRVLVVVTEEYRRRYYRETPPGIGDGVCWEGRLIRNHSYRRLTDDPRLAVLLMDDTAASYIPDALGGLPAYKTNSPAQIGRLHRWISSKRKLTGLRERVVAPFEGEPEQSTLALIDVVDFTQLARVRGARGTAALTEALHDEVQRCAAGWDIEVIKMLGDAALLKINQASILPEFFLKVSGREGIRKLDGEGVNVRVVATSGFVAFSRSEGRITDAHGPSVIRLFRIEKHGGPRELLITAQLIEAFQDKLPGLRISETREMVPQLKGFVYGDDPDPAEPSVLLVRLTPPRPSTGARDEADVLGARMAALAEDSARIRILADLWDPLPMTESFIKLRLTSGSTPHATGGFRHKEVDYDRRATVWRGDREGQSPAEFFSSSACACVVGLPGSGKTTLLRHFAHFTFNNERKRAPGDDRTVVLLVACRHLTDEDFRRTPKSEPAVPGDLGGVLRVLTAAFLKRFQPDHRRRPFTVAQLKLATEEVFEAWTQGRAVVLIDALDEADLAGGSFVHEAVRGMFRLLSHDLDSRRNVAGTSGSRCYLTARQIERHGLKSLGAPIHDVNALSDRDLWDFAGHLLATDETLLRRFRNGLTEDPVIARIGGTPLTATLLVHHFRTLGRFDVRYAAYDMFCVFMLGGFWELDKQRRLPPQPEAFRAALEAKANEPDVRDRYDALAELCFRMLHEGGARPPELNRETLHASFEARLAKRGATGTKRNTVRRWIRDLVSSQMLISAGGDSWHFLHQTVMEYLAARHLVNEMADAKLLDRVCREKNRDGRETLPIACGHVASSGADGDEGDVPRPETGYRVLAALRKRFGRGLAGSTLAIRCLAEVEGVELRHFDRIVVPGLRQELECVFDDAVKKRAWLYRILAKLLTEADEETVAKWKPALAGIVPLPRDVLVKRFLK